MSLDDEVERSGHGTIRPVTAPAAPEVPRWLQLGVGALLAIVIVVGWGAGLSWGLWLDETFTVWQVDQGVAAIIPHKLGDSTQSVLFGTIEALCYFPGSPHMEAWLRLPSMVGGVACCFLIYRLAESFVGRGTGMLAAIALAGSPAMIVYSSQARPYTLAVAACFATILCLQRWLETGAWRWGIGAATRSVARGPPASAVCDVRGRAGVHGLAPGAQRRAHRMEASVHAGGCDRRVAAAMGPTAADAVGGCRIRRRCRRPACLSC